MSTDWEAWLAQSGWARLWPEGTDCVILDAVDSTMAEAARRAPPERPTWIFAHRQTEARGRRGRPWQQPQGNFAATFLFRPNRPAREAALTSFAAAVAVHEALSLWDRDKALTLKWPNDVLFGGRKLAGILLESAGRGDRIDWLAVGIGINLTHAPPPEILEQGALPPVALAEVTEYPHPMAKLGDHDREALLVHLAHAMAAQLSSWDQFGFDLVRSAWSTRHGARKGQKMTARLPRETLTGTFEALDDDGRLVLNTPDGLRKIAAADVFYD